MVLIMFLNDFLTMSITTDRMEVSFRPNRWNTRGILLTATVLAMCKLAFSLSVLLWGYYALNLPPGTLQTLTFATIIISSQAGVYMLRERQHFWKSRPSRYVAFSSVLGLGVAALLAMGGILMPAIQPLILLAVVGVAAGYFVALDWVKVLLFKRLDLR
jgi:H+-transporting ATPase